jgi:type I restriction enzyme S subunit
MGEVGIVDYDDPNTFLGQRIMQYRANPTKLDSNFLLYSFLSPDLQYQFRKHDNSGSIVSHIRVPDCFEFEINTPPLETQKAISKVLSDLDYKISLNNRINQELEAVAKLIYDYWFVQFDFPMTKEQAEAMGKSELVGKPYKSSGGKMVYNEQLKREIPEGWGVKELADIADTINDSVDPSNEPDRNFKYYSIPIWDDKKSYELTRGAEIGSNKYSVNDKRIVQ